MVGGRDPADQGPLKIPSEGLLAFDRLEQRFEVPGSEAAGAAALDDLEEERGPVLDGAGEDLEQIALVVAVHEDAQALEVAVALEDLPDPARGVRVVGP